MREVGGAPEGAAREVEEGHPRSVVSEVDSVSRQGLNASESSRFARWGLIHPVIAFGKSRPLH